MVEFIEYLLSGDWPAPCNSRSMLQRLLVFAAVCCAACPSSTKPHGTVAPLVFSSPDGGAAATDFAFLPPLATGGPAVGVLAEDLSPTFVISEVSLTTGTALAEVARFGEGAPTALNRIAGCCYEALWNTAGLTRAQSAEPTGFLVDVQLNGASLGSMTVVLVGSASDLSSVDTSKNAGAISGQVVTLRVAIGPCAGIVCAEKACQTGVCTNGACRYQAVADQVACDDHSACTTGDVCQAGACVGHGLDCTDGTACTIDSCDPMKGCVHAPAPDGTSCPNSGCGGTATCKAGACDVQSAPAFCDDGNGCTAEACIGNGVCSHTAIAVCSQRLTATWSITASAVVTLAGADFQPGEQVSLKLDGVEQGPITATADGTLAFVAPIAGATASVGTHVALATGLTGSVATSYVVFSAPVLHLVVAGSGNLGTEILASEHLTAVVTGLQPGEHVFYAVDATPTDPRLNIAADSSGQATLDNLFTSAIASGAHVLRVFDTSVTHWHADQPFLIRRPVLQPIGDVAVGSSYVVTITDLPAGRPIRVSAADAAGNAEGESTVTPDGVSPTQVTLIAAATAPLGDWTMTWRDLPASLTRQGSLTFRVVHNDAHAPSWSPLGLTSLHRLDKVGVRATFLHSNEQVSFVLDGALVGQAQATAGGVLEGDFTVPSDALLGPRTLEATGDQSSNHAYAVRVLNDAPWSISATPARVGAGASLTVSGVGAVPDELVSVQVLDAGGTVLVSKSGLVPDAKGLFSVVVAVPLGAAAGTLTVSAVHLLGGVQQGAAATTTVSYGAQITVTPNNAHPGDTLHVTGDGFAANESVAIALDGTLAVSTTTTASGTISADLLFLNPGGTPQHLVVATGSMSLLSASAAVVASGFCSGVQVSTISGSGDAGFDNGTGGPPDLGSTWQVPWGIAVVPGSNPRRLWVADQGNAVVRELIAEPGDTGSTSTIATSIADSVPAIPFADVRGLSVAVDNFGPFQQAVLADASQKCFLRRFSQQSDWHAFTPNCDAAAVSPVAVYTYLDVPNGAAQLYFGALDDGLGCIVEGQPEFERHLRRACRPAGSSVKLEAIAVDSNNVLFTNNWLSADGGTADGVMRIEGYLETGNADTNPPLVQSIFVTSTGSGPLHASALVVGGDGYLYLADANAGAIYRISSNGKEVLLLAGGQPAGAPFADGTGCEASFSQPRGLAWAQNAGGPVLYVTDSGNHRVRRLVLPP